MTFPDNLASFCHHIIGGSSYLFLQEYMESPSYEVILSVYK